MREARIEKPFRFVYVERLVVGVERCERVADVAAEQVAPGSHPLAKFYEAGAEVREREERIFVRREVERNEDGQRREEEGDLEDAGEPAEGGDD